MRTKTRGEKSVRFEGCESRLLLSHAPLAAPPALAPKVAAVYVSSTTWSSTFKNQLATAGKGSAQYGYAIPSGAQQANVLAWRDLNQVSITFNQAVSVQKDDLIIRGANQSQYNTSSFSYNAATKTATWTLTAGTSFVADKLLLELDADGYQSIYDSGGFESPRFTTDDVEGNGVPAGQGSWLQTGTAGQGLVENSLAATGTQAVSITRAGGEDARWGVHETVAAPFAPISIQWDEYVKQTSFPLPGSFGPYMAVEAYDDLGNPPRLAGSAGVDASTGEVLYQSAGSGYLVSTGQTLPFNSWHHFNMVLNYATHSYSVFVDGNLLVNNIGFVDAGVNDFTDAPFAAVAAGGDDASQNASGQAYFDNYSITLKAPAGDQSIYNSGGFELPLFTPGNLGGSDAALSQQDFWVRTGRPGVGAVENSLSNGGTQAVSITRQGADERWAIPTTIANPSSPVIIKWDEYVKQTILPVGSFGPYMGVEAYDALNNSPLLAGSAGVDASTGEILYQQGGTGYIVSTGQTVPFNTWHHFDMVLNYSSHTYSVYVDGSPMASNIGFVDPGISDFTDAPLAALAAAADSASQNASAQAYFDNYSIGLATTPVNTVGLPLDGEWVNSVSTFPSGDGSAGGDFRFAINAVTGDINGNGAVDFPDLVVVAQHYGQSSSFPAQGDLNGDGVTDFNDLVTIAQNYGHTLPGLAAAPLPATLPGTTSSNKKNSNASLFNSTVRIAAKPPAVVSRPATIARH